MAKVASEQAAGPDVVVVGGGPAGYAAAIGLAQGGAAVHLVEADRPGGTCLQRGCVPTKALLESARVARSLAAAAQFGVRISGETAVDFAAVRERQDRVVADLTRGLEQLLRTNRVTLVRGYGTLVPPARSGAVPGVRVEGPDGATLRPQALVLAPGSTPARPALPGAELPGVVDSDGLLARRAFPARLLIIGGGAVGCEFASAYADLGSSVTLVEVAPQLLPAADAEIARRLAAALRRRGVTVHVGAQVAQIQPGPVVQVQSADAACEVAVDVVLLATGRSPRTAGLGLEACGLGTAGGGRLAVDDALRCVGASGVWAGGDAIGGPGLAHVAFGHAQRICAGILDRPLPPEAPVPYPVFSFPEVAWVGLTEAAARAVDPAIRVARVPFAALGRAHAAGETDGLCKLIAAADGRLLGAHLLGGAATELVAIAGLALQQGATADDLAGAMPAHPTLAEGLGEAALWLRDRPLHLPRSRT